MNKPEAVIVDVDGTLVDVTSTRHHVLGKRKNFHAFHSDTANCPPHDIVIQMCQMHAAAGREIIVVTARKYHWEAMTQDWLYRNLPVRFHGPYMRGDDDNRPDTEIKRQIFKQLSERFTITHAIDDNPKIIALWKELGLEVATVPGWSEEVAAEYTKLAEKQGIIDGFTREAMSKVEEIIKTYNIYGHPLNPKAIAKDLEAAGLLRIRLPRGIFSETQIDKLKQMVAAQMEATLRYQDCDWIELVDIVLDHFRGIPDETMTDEEIRSQIIRLRQRLDESEGK